MVKTDRFGNPQVVVGCKPNRKNPDFSVGFVEISGKLFKLEPSQSKKEGVSCWIRITEVKKQHTSSSFGSGGAYGRRGL